MVDHYVRVVVEQLRIHSFMRFMHNRNLVDAARTGNIVEVQNILARGSDGVSFLVSISIKICHILLPYLAFYQSIEYLFILFKR